MAEYPSINREENFNNLIDKLYLHKHQEYEVRLFQSIREVLVFAAVLGFSLSERKTLSKKGEPVKWNIFESNKSEEFIYLISLASTKNSSILKHDIESIKSCVTIFEEHANAGLHIIDKWINIDYAGFSIEDAILNGINSINKFKNENSISDEELMDAMLES